MLLCYYELKKKKKKKNSGLIEIFMRESNSCPT